MLLVRFALCCAISYGLGRYSGAKGPKLDPSFRHGRIPKRGRGFDPHRPYQFSYSIHRTCENPEAAKGSINSKAASASE
jgi:hypothetical protein